MSRLTRDGTAEPVSRDQILRHVRGQGNIHFSCSADHEQDWQPYPVDPYSCYMLFLLFVVYLTLTDPLRIQPWSQDRRNQTKSNRESEISRESRQKRTDKKVASKGHRRDKIENINKNTQTVETN